MKYSETHLGRIFVLRLEDGEIVHEVIEQFARDHAVRAAALIILGGADDGSKLVVGPEYDRVYPINPMERVFFKIYGSRQIYAYFVLPFFIGGLLSCAHSGIS